MSIETLLASLTTAIDRNTEALNKLGSAAPAAGKPGGKGAGGDAPKVTQEQVNAALIRVKDDHGMDEAKKIIKDFGKVEKMAEIKPATYQAVYDAAIAAHTRLTEAAAGGGDI